MKRFLIYHLPAILYGGLIIYVSSIPNLNRPDFSLFKYDKLIHFLEYAIFAFLICRSFFQLIPHRKYKYVTYLSLLFLTLFALFDEFFQSRIPGRESDILDVFSDILGGFLLVVILHIRHRKRLSVK